MCLRYAHRLEGCWPPWVGLLGGLTICPGRTANTCPDTCLRQAAYLMLAAAAIDTPPQTVT
eukprot:scaffold377690_cov11-Prasinocladus_malaysianus.AAC.1